MYIGDNIKKRIGDKFDQLFYNLYSSDLIGDVLDFNVSYGLTLFINTKLDSAHPWWE